MSLDAPSPQMTKANGTSHAIETRVKAYPKAASFSDGNYVTGKKRREQHCRREASVTEVQAA
jgi:hypothetical protein